ncbi:protein of unknown function (plasmid) [Cardinium endosymbiont cEper1 of Encarsia pergandiella]|uniref:hypothetical protein n=1 Tax=Cardinium endosymbiont of Encarsia pergandiella TaxID=249402 RepID=UPI00027E9E1A|nr:hypothetical protein [Cardinium endosymbiont of Encarsia pergandiella]CCM10646.1 protein of unknown function [Cardinium endosymbiont cEper1 of Encarsia pergandiella]
MVLLDIGTSLNDWIKSGYDLLKLIAKLLSVVGCVRLAYLYHVGRDKGCVFYELLHWIGAIVFFSSIEPIYNMIANFFKIT